MAGEVLEAVFVSDDEPAAGWIPISGSGDGLKESVNRVLDQVDAAKGKWIRGVARSVETRARYLGYRSLAPRRAHGRTRRQRAAVGSSSSRTDPPDDPDPEHAESALNDVWTSALDLFQTVEEFQTLAEYARIRSVWLGRWAS